MAMLIAYPVGRLLGGIAQRGVDDQIARHTAQNPIPEDPARDSEPISV